ncbi:YfhO family protein [Riemerella anatipestifer]|uniref:YfhO family protein n=1 Tax=Riemerella anatipestifer TaxID=34085 RepID=UPI0012ADBA99|nr:YfhO family protein [Riemerella anatipestifer]USL95153.1 YfhO family protein [Riemerella anatipestifer]
MNLKHKNLVFIIGSLVIFVLIAVLYANPIISGKQLMQPDIVHYKGGAKELLDYRAKYSTETYWSDAMFGGMPTYQTGAQFRGDLIKQVDNILNFLPKPANYLFLLFSGFFLLGMVAVRNWKYALLGASFFGLSTYFYIIIAAGHNGKVHTVAYFAPLLAGILLVYIRKKYILGFIVTALFMGLQIAANHIQMTYYLFIALGFLFISELVRAIKGNTTWKHFGISSGVLALAIALGVGMNAQRLMANAEYVKETVRGKQILNTEKGNTEKSGMDKESITMWSYGKLETLNLFIPRLMGGGSQEKDSERMMGRIQELVQENATSQEEVNNIIRGLSSPTYWGDQPMTSGPAYQGAVVCFLAVLGFVFARRKYKYWILGASALTIMLAWGHHFMPLTDFFIDYVPLYNKFRAPSSILVVVELLFPLIGILGLYQFFKNQNLSKELKQKYLIYTTASVLGFTVILLVGGKSLLDFYNDTEKTYLPPYLLNYLQDERWQFFRADAIKAILYVGITAIVLWLSLKEKLSQNIALVIIGLVSLFDLWTVNQRYLNSSNFVDKTFAENPFQKENNDYLIGKAGDNPYIQGLLSQVNINKTLETLAEKDKSHYRIFNNTLGTFGETNTSYFKASIGGYSAAKLRRYDDLINEYFSKQDTVALPKVLNMLNAKYFVVGSADNPQAYPNPDANGNAWFVSDILWANTPNEEIKAIGTIDNKRTAVVSTEDKSYFNGKNIQPDSTAYIQLTQYQPNEIQLKSQSKTPQLAVISEIYYPKGWKMFVDNQEVPYIKANYLLRAVYVPAGNHTIKMVFDPEVLHKGKLWSYGAFGVFILLSILGILKLYKEQNATA